MTSLDSALITSLRWMPRCACGRCATHLQSWSDRGEVYYCARPSCVQAVHAMYDNDHDYDKVGLVRKEVLWATTARLVNTATSL